HSIVHALLPNSVICKNKADSKWWYDWVGVCAPIIASIAAVELFKFLYL
ncbi:aquaporin, partial [Streptococcus suis]